MKQKSLLNIKSKTLMIVASILVAIFVILAFFIYFLFINNYTNTSIRLTLKETSTQSSQSISAQINGSFNTLKSIATQISLDDTLYLDGNPYVNYQDNKATNINATKMSDMLALLSTQRQLLGYTRLGIILPIKDDVNNAGFSFPVAEVAESGLYVQRQYFTDALAGKTVITEVLKDLVYDGALVNVYATPIYFTQGDTRVIRGVLFATMFTHDLDTLLSPNTFDGEGYSYLVNDKGKIVWSPKHKNAHITIDDTDIFALYSKYSQSFSPAMADDIRQNFATGSDGEFILDEGDNLTRFVNYTKLPISNSDWFLFSTVPEFVATRQTRQLQLSTLLITLFSLVAFSGVAIAFVLYQRKTARQAIVDKQTIQTIISNISGVVIETNVKTGKIEFASDKLYDLTGYTSNDISTLFDDNFCNLVVEEDRQTVLDAYDKSVASNTPTNLEYRICTSDGGYIWVYDKSSYNIINNASTNLRYSVLIDVTQKKQQEQQLVNSHFIYKAIAEMSNAILFQLDLQSKRITFNNKFIDVLGYDKKEYSLHDLRELCLLDDETTQELLDKVFNVTSADTYEKEIRVKHSSGKTMWFLIKTTRMFYDDKNISLIVGRLSNIDIRMKETKKLETLANCDISTGFYNKKCTQLMIDKCLSQVASNTLSAFYYLDIDDFKGINDTYSHADGDIVILELTRALKNIFPKTSIFGRIGGDEFVVFVNGIPNKQYAQDKADEINATVRNINKVNAKCPNFTVSVGGIVITKATTYDKLAELGDASMYRCKARGKNMNEITIN